MWFRKLGMTDLEVSVLSLGTMTFGEQCAKNEAFQIMDFCLESGINLIDTAEMYPIYPRRETYGNTEEIIGDWIRSRANRSKVIIATKVASCHPQGIGASGLSWIRGGGKNLRFDKKNLNDSINGTLKRLKTDYVDLYQLHWPERCVPITGQPDYSHDPNEYQWTPILEVLENMQDLVAAGKIRHFGLSNESPWGFSKFINTSERYNLPRPVSIQNSYNLLNRVFDMGNSEISIREGCGLLAYSPLAGGRLSGKYLNGNRPDDARYTKWPGPNHRHHGKRGNEAILKYSELANKYGLSIINLAIAFVISRPFVTSVIIGAKSLSQIKEVVKSIELKLSSELSGEIQEIHLSDPNPCV
jgi:aryl-alcohol dehydrogenase-like predicted oxidoreductase